MKTMDNKSELRREVRLRIKSMSADERLAAAVGIFQRVEELEAFSKARCVAFYAAMHDEVPTKDWLVRWLELGKRVVVPKVEEDIMRFYDYSPDRMVIGAFGIEEPIAGVECPPEDIDFIVVPARAFTPDGWRMGRGGGFYDKYMSQPGMRAYKCGVAFSCQIFDTLPIDAHDIPVDIVIY